MTRRLLVNLLALLVIALIGGAASAQNQARTAVEERAPEATPPVEVPAEVPAADAAAAVAEDDDEATGPGGVQAVEAVEDGDDDGFGVIRSAEVERFGECMDAAGEGEDGHEARAACRELRPGPAHLNPAHPNHGKLRGQGAGARPDHAGPPDHAGGPPDHAGRPDHAGGPPDHAGRPDHAGPPDHAGQGRDSEG